MQCDALRCVVRLKRLEQGKLPSRVVLPFTRRTMEDPSFYTSNPYLFDRWVHCGEGLRKAFLLPIHETLNLPDRAARNKCIGHCCIVSFSHEIEMPRSFWNASMPARHPCIAHETDGRRLGLYVRFVQ